MSESPLYVHINEERVFIHDISNTLTSCLLALSSANRKVKKLDAEGTDPILEKLMVVQDQLNKLTTQIRDRSTSIKAKQAATGT